MILEPKKTKSLTVSTVSPSILPSSDWTGCHDLNFFLILCVHFLIYLLMPVLGLHCYTLSFPSFGEWGLLFDVMGGLLTVVASLDEHRLQSFRSFSSWAPERGLGRCGARAQ